MRAQWNIEIIIWLGQNTQMAQMLPEFQSLARKGWNYLKIQNKIVFIEQWESPGSLRCCIKLYICADQ